MPDPSEPTAPDVEARLHAAAVMLRESNAVDPAVRSNLAELIDELGRALAASAAPPAEVAKLAEGTAHLVEALHHRHDRGLVSASRDRLEGLVLQAEARAPAAVSLARGVIDALAGLGI